MRRYLTGYAVTYNLRHHQQGHLFQNRYHSIVCDEEVYFRELVLSELDRYRWCGHAVLMGWMKYPWQDRDYVLSWLGSYAPTIDLIPFTLSQQNPQSQESSDPRPFPPSICATIRPLTTPYRTVPPLRRPVQDASPELSPLPYTSDKPSLLLHLSSRAGEQSKRVETILEGECEKGKISFEELRMGSRRGRIPRARSEIAERLVKELGMSLAEVTRLLGVSTSAIYKILKRIAHEGIE